MNYKESKLILEKIESSRRILLNCHRGPDPDSIGCALAMYAVLTKMGKMVGVVCSSTDLYDRLDFLSNYSKIEKNVDFSKLDYSHYDLFIIMDSSSWDMVSGDGKIVIPKIPAVVIDHHITNTFFGNINFVDTKATSVGEMLFKVFQDWGVIINKETADCLMAAIVGDTGSFRYPNLTYETFEIAANLMRMGADKDKMVFQIYQQDPFNLIRFYGEGLSRVEIDKENKFIWIAIPFEKYCQLDGLSSVRESLASLFAQNVEGTDFGVVMTEEEENILSISFRSRTGFDVSKVAIELGGGGHQYASGAKVRDLLFNEAVGRVLEICRKYAKKYR